MKKLRYLFLMFVSSSLAGFQAVDLNTANAEQIALLPGIGIKLAKSIINFRQKNNLLSNIEELLEIPGFREAQLNKIKNLVILTKPKVISIPPRKKNLKTLELKSIIKLADLEKHVLKNLNLSDDWHEDISRRSKNAAWVPTLSLLFDYDLGVDHSEKSIKNQHDFTLARGGHDVGVGLRATFNLSELIFNKVELEISNLNLKRLEKREKILERVHSLYFRYERLQREPAMLEPELFNKIILEREEIGAALDSLSNFAFSDFQRTLL